MNVFKRVKIQIRSNIEELLNSIENHEAVTEAAIQEYQQHYAKAKVKYERMLATERTTQSQLEKTEKDVDQWKARATRLGNENRERAIECLKRMKAAEQHAENLRNELGNLQSSVLEVKSSLEEMRSRIEEVKRKRDQLIVRDSSSRTLSTVKQSVAKEPSCTDVFQRWEEKVVMREVSDDLEFEKTDHFERELAKAEQNEALSLELDELLAESKEG